MPESSGLVEVMNRSIELSAARILNVGEHAYIDKDKTVTLVKPKYPVAVSVTTLTGIVALLENLLEFQNVVYGSLVMQVESFEKVSVYSRFTDSYGNRQVLIEAKPIQNNAFVFNQFETQEKFNIALMSLFVPDDCQKALLEISGNLAKQTEVRQEDDGMTQRVTAKSGVHLLKERTVQPRVTLKPYRTFRECEQPASDFIFRVKNDEERGNFCGLFEADGGYWKIQAMKNVAEYLSNRLAGSVVDLIKGIPVVW